MLYDLHIHSHYSIDAKGNLENVFRKLPNSKFCKIAITDHNTFDHYSELYNSLLSNPDLKNKLIMGCELSCVSNSFRNIEFHILGYWNLLLNENCFENVINITKELKKISREQFVFLIKEFKEKKEIINFWQIYKKDILSNTVSEHPFILNLYNKTLSGEDYTQFQNKRRFIKKQLAQEKNWPRFPTDERIINVINESNGISILAHPESYNISKKELNLLIRCLKDKGLHGIEIKNKFVENLQKEFHLIATTGSDLHNVDIFNSQEHLDKLVHKIDLTHFLTKLNSIKNSNQI